MTYRERLYEEQMLVAAKSIIIDDMLVGIINGKKYDDLNNKDKIKLHGLVRERGKLFNKPTS